MKIMSGVDTDPPVEPDEEDVPGDDADDDVELEVEDE
jgi:hypothetical protein